MTYIDNLRHIIFFSEAHKEFYYKKLKEVRHQDVYHMALCCSYAPYCWQVIQIRYPEYTNTIIPEYEGGKVFELCRRPKTKT